jgi:hypothetical protein
MTWLLLTILTWLWYALVFAQVHPMPGPGVKGAAVGGSPVRTGTPVGFGGDVLNANSANITIPADATFVLCHWSFYSATTLLFTNAQSVTLGGVAMTRVGGDASNAAYMGGVAYLLAAGGFAPATQTLAWDLAGTTVPAEALHVYCAYYKQVNTSTPVRGSSCTQAGTPPFTTGTLTALSGDLIAAWAWAGAGTEETFTFSGSGGATVVANIAAIGGNGDSALGEASPTGNQTITASNSPNPTDGGICGIVLRP